MCCMMKNIHKVIKLYKYYKVTYLQLPKVQQKKPQYVVEYSLVVKLTECWTHLVDHHLVMPECEVAVCFVKELLHNIIILLYAYDYKLM